MAGLQPMKFTVFYDGNCPLCAAEMTLLANYDHHSRLCLEDIHARDFSQRYPNIDLQAANQILHGQTPDGTLVYGLDVTVTAWGLVGKKPWLKVLRWPLVRWFADKAYLFFAKHRMGFAFFLTGRRCINNDVCLNSAEASQRRTTPPHCAKNMDEDADF